MFTVSILENSYASKCSVLLSIDQVTTYTHEYLVMSLTVQLDYLLKLACYMLHMLAWYLITLFAKGDICYTGMFLWWNQKVLITKYQQIQ